MIVRRGNAEHDRIDYGPTPDTGYRRIGGSMALPLPQSRPLRVRDRSFDINEWKRMKRATDPEWAERERARDRARKVVA